jgi:hypothetical protein
MISGYSDTPWCFQPHHIGAKHQRILKNKRSDDRWAIRDFDAIRLCNQTQLTFARSRDRQRVEDHNQRNK